MVSTGIDVTDCFVRLKVDVHVLDLSNDGICEDETQKVIQFQGQKAIIFRIVCNHLCGSNIFERHKISVVGW